MEELLPQLNQKFNCDCDEVSTGSGSDRVSPGDLDRHVT